MIEDYNTAHEFRIFGEEYLRHRPFLVKSTFVYSKAFIKEGWVNRDTGKKGDPRIQFNSFQLLHDVMESYAKKLTIQLDINELSDSRIDDLKELLGSHTGSHTLNFVIYEMAEQLKLHMPSRKQKVNISQDLLIALEDESIYYKLN